MSTAVMPSTRLWWLFVMIAEAVLRQALDEVDLPQRSRAVERPRLDAGHELLELLVGAGVAAVRCVARGSSC